jgi:carboxyl-terminal processing protease
MARQAMDRSERLKKKARKFFTNKQLLFLVFFLTLGIGYIAGTFHLQIIGTVGPLFGLKIYTGTLDDSSLQETYQNLKANYDGTLDDQTLIDGANKGLVEAVGDEYTEYLNAVEADEFENDLTGNIGGGIGAEISVRSDRITIIRILDDNPAKEAGLLAGDVVQSVNDESTEGETVEEVVSKIRGEEGTTVKLEILRGDTVKTFTITRAIVKNPSVVATISGDLGTLTISRFDQETATLARSAAQQFVSSGVKKVILDLRGNGGGYLTAAQSLAGLWLDNEVVVSERSNGVVTDRLYSDSNPILGSIQTVVLVNASSASASEIVAGALQDYDKATIIGEQTYGKGSVQKLITLSGGAELKVTIAKWYTPKNQNISEQGITPDKVVPLSAEDTNAGRDPQLDAGKETLGL